MGQVKYRFAVDSLGQVVDACDLAGKSIDTTAGFNCLACGDRMIARVQGEKQQPHFGHHPGTTCREETYLHLLGKKVFEEVYRDCLVRDVPFEIEISHGFVCRRFEEHTGEVCVLDRREKQAYDLTNYFREIQVEQRTDRFVPDLILLDERRPNFRVFVEIAVTHFLSKSKRRSKERIIEIPLTSEADLAKIRGRRLTEATASFINFAINSHAVASIECLCATKPACALVVFADSGKSKLLRGPLSDIIADKVRCAPSIGYFSIHQVGSDSIANLNFQDALVDARRSGYPVKNCYLCRHHGTSFKGEPGRPIYCKKLKHSCDSNFAVKCGDFSDWTAGDHRQKDDARQS